MFVRATRNPAPRVTHASELTLRESRSGQAGVRCRSLADLHERETTIEAGDVDQPAGRLALYVMGDGAMTSFPLPSAGEVSIGRSNGADVALDDPLVSRRHALLRLGERLQVTDLGSRHGTRVGEQTLEPNQPMDLQPGDMIYIGTSILVLQASGLGSRSRRLWTHGFFTTRVEEECTRGARTGRPFGVARVRVEGAAARVERALGESVRSFDVLGIYVPGEYEILFVEVGPEQLGPLIERLKDGLAEQGLRPEIRFTSFPDGGRSPEALLAACAFQPTGPVVARAPVLGGSLKRLEPLMTRIAAGDISILLIGETGVGKEVVTEHLVSLSRRAGGPLLRLNCAAFSETLLESELFGHEKGAFTGATGTKQGLLETADGGTIFLDEIGELPLSMQVKLLRVLETRQVQRVGALKPRTIDVRFISATNRDLDAEIERGAFRRDLYYRLNGVCLVIPPLRERLDELESLALAFVAEHAARVGRATPKLSAEALDVMRQYAWPGNVRELRSMMERAVLMCEHAIQPEHLLSDRMVLPEAMARPSRPTSHIPDRATVPPSAPTTGQTDERRRILEALEQTGGNQTRAAKLLGMSLRTLVNRLSEYDVPRPRKPTQE